MLNYKAYIEFLKERGLPYFRNRFYIRYDAEECGFSIFDCDKFSGLSLVNLHYYYDMESGNFDCTRIDGQYYGENIEYDKHEIYDALGITDDLLKTIFTNMKVCHLLDYEYPIHIDFVLKITEPVKLPLTKPAASYLSFNLMGKMHQILADKESEDKKMKEAELEFIGDKLFLCTPLPEYGERVCKTQLVMTKEIFQECYKRWIEPQESEE